MAGNFHRDSKSGDIPGISQTQSTRTVNGDSLLLDNSGMLGGILNAESLPINKVDSTGRINWLGSSYSGTDIKVVAHLYDAYGANDELESLHAQRDIFAAIEDGAKNLLDNISIIATLFVSPNSGLDYSAKRTTFQRATGLTPGDPASQAAINYLVTNIFNVASFTLIGLTKVRQRAMNIHEDYKLRRESAEARISDLQRVKDTAQATVTLATLQTISLQTHREKYGVRALGHSYAKGYTRGPRTIAGSMVFTVFDEHSLSALMRAMGREQGIWKNRELSTLLPDQLPPIDITLAFANEYGSLSELRIFGLEFVNDGMTMSIEDLLTEQICNFVARDCDVMTSKGNILLSRLQRGGTGDPIERELSASSLLFNNERYNDYLDKLGVRRRLLNR